MKHMVKFTALVCCSLAAASLFAADPATGWKQTAVGTYDYNNTDNWVDGEINGIFGSDLTLAGAQTITFAADTALTNGLTIAYAGNYAMTFTSLDDSTKTLTLGGDITSSMSGSSAAVVTFDSSLAIDLDNSGCTITANSANGVLDIKAAIANGSLTIAGDKTLKLAGANTYAGGTTIAGSTYVYVNSATAFGTGDVSINAVLHLCADADLTMTANNTFYMNADRFAYNSGKTLDIGTGDFVATNSFKFFAEGDSLTIHGRIVDKDGNLAPWKLQKWGSKKLYTYSAAVMSEGGKFEIGNGEWYFNGAISGTGFTVDASTATGGTQHFRLQSANTFQGTLSITGGSLYVYAGNEYAIPNGSKVSIGAGTYFIGNGKSNYISSLMANNGVTTDSNGTLCFNSSDSGDIDLTDYPDLVLGSRGGARTYSGTITWPDINPLRLGGGGDSFTFSLGNAIPTGRDFEILGKVRFTAASDADGVVTVRNGGLLLLEEGNGALPDAKIVVEQGGELRLSSSVACDIVRAADVTLKAGLLNFNGNKNTAVKHKITKLTLMAMPGVGGTPQITWSTKDSKQTTLHIGTIERPDFCFLNLASGGNLGATECVSGWNILVDNGVENLGGGTADTVTAPVVPWVRQDTSFVYYDPTKGFRLRNSSESKTYTAAAQLSGPEADGENMVFNSSAGGTLELDGKEMNLTSFAFGYQGKEMYLTSPNGRINMLGAAIMCDGNGKTHFDATVNFGSNRGYIYERAGKGQTFGGVIEGTGGLTIGNWNQGNNSGSGGTGLECAFTNSTFTGDVHIFDRVDSVKNGCFPYGERTGNTYLHGFWLCGNFSVSLNGLYGAGYMQLGNGYNITYTLGCDGSDGDYDGRINRSNGTFNLTKIGAGRQRFGGECTHNGATTVSNGTLQVDGAFTQSAVTVAEGATLAGCGTFGGAVTLADGAKLEVGSAKLGESDAEMTFESGITFQGDSAVTFKVLGKTAVAKLVVAPTIEVGGKLTISLDSKDLKGGEYCLFKSDSALSIDSYSRGANCGPLSLKEGGKQLWMKKNTSFIITLR